MFERLQAVALTLSGSADRSSRTNSVEPNLEALKRRMMSCSVAATTKYSCLRRSSLPSKNCDSTISRSSTSERSGPVHRMNCERLKKHLMDYTWSIHLKRTAKNRMHEIRKVVAPDQTAEGVFVGSCLKSEISCRKRINEGRKKWHNMKSIKQNL